MMPKSCHILNFEKLSDNYVLGALKAEKQAGRLHRAFMPQLCHAFSFI